MNNEGTMPSFIAMYSISRIQDRIKHLAFHFAKYVGRLAELRSYRDARFRITLADTFIIALSAADAVNVVIATLLVARVGNCNSLPEMGRLFTQREQLGKNGIVHYLFRALATETGRMAKACEALDHKEAFDYEKTFRRSIVGILRACLIAAAVTTTDLESIVRERWKEVERKQIL